VPRSVTPNKFNSVTGQSKQSATRRMSASFAAASTGGAVTFIRSSLPKGLRSHWLRPGVEVSPPTTRHLGAPSNMKGVNCPRLI
jgi:hypothetical protein